MRTLALTLGLVLSTGAFASPPAPATATTGTSAKEVLIETAKAEAEAMDAIIAALDSHNPLPVTEAAKTAYANGKAKHTEAKTLWGGKKYKDAYVKFREAADLVEPALGEMLAQPAPPQNVIDAGVKLVTLNASRVDQLASAIAARADGPAKTAYSEGKALYTEAKTLWDAGSRKDASVKAWQSLKKLDIAVKEMWAAEH